MSTTNERILVVDSRDRDDTSNEDRSFIKVEFDRPKTFRTIEMLYMDLPIDAEEDDEEALYFIRIDEVGNRVEGAKSGENSTLIQVRTVDTDYRCIAYKNGTFGQVVDLGSAKTFDRFSIRIFYRKNSTNTLIMASDYIMIFRLG